VNLICRVHASRAACLGCVRVGFGSKLKRYDESSQNYNPHAKKFKKWFVLNN
jgi:hypothetical protein